jgi:serine/threonine protein kinase
MILIIPKVKLHRNEKWKRALRIEMELLCDHSVGVMYIRQCLQIKQNLLTLELHYEDCTETLREYIKRERVVVMPTLGDFVVHLQRALQYVHQNNIVHQNVHSDSIFIAQKYNCPVLKLGNFKSATMAFYPCTNSPLRQESLQVTFQCDLFAFGLVLYEMITGRLTPVDARGLSENAFPIPNACPDLLQNVLHVLVPQVKINGIKALGSLPFFYDRYCGLAFVPTQQLHTKCLDLATDGLNDEEAGRISNAIEKYKQCLDIMEALMQTVDDFDDYGAFSDINISLDKRLCRLLFNV